MKAILILAIVLQVILATQSEGLTRSLAELSAFLLVLGLVFSIKKTRHKKAAFEPEEL
ncbi:hypothetical protein [Vibrio hepatarius]|mgnify:CR=1 FL=1|jgi:hypothetical protein|uniref:hypothetical protein n=1 Tax=Vibrio hepatarius TaxID=171383 RepID=UPI000AA713C3|nr:hypothetical protein [Vibrio hepatarius]NIY81628.1 hypothetical protein [Vibrio hepatarius]NVJ56958.1 hypothetical protein [Vibrionaceae bacterium]